jgi:hypothetical protein
MKRFTHYLLVLLLAFSTVTLTAHAVVHADAGAEQCLLCASHAGAEPVVAGDPPGVPVVAGHRLIPEPVGDVPRPVKLARLPETRAPPVPS